MNFWIVTLVSSGFVKLSSFIIFWKIRPKKAPRIRAESSFDENSSRVFA